MAGIFRAVGRAGRRGEDVECGRSRETQQRSDLAGWAEYGYCASHSRYFWGLRIHLVATLHGLPLGWALTRAKVDEREVFDQTIAAPRALASVRSHGQTIADTNYYGRRFVRDHYTYGIDLLRPTRHGEQPRPGARFLTPRRQRIESIFDTPKGQLDLERHGGKTIAGVCPRVAQRLLTLTVVIWHNDQVAAPTEAHSPPTTTDDPLEPVI